MRLTVNQPNIPPGMEIEIPGLGLFANGEVHNVEDEAVESAKARGYNIREDGVYGEPLSKKPAKSAKAESAQAPEETE